MDNIWQRALKLDARRAEPLAYIKPQIRDELSALILFDNELWNCTRRANEAILARIRIQYWVDELGRIKDNQAANTPIGEALKTIIKANKYNHLLDMIDAHIAGLENHPKRNILQAQNIWCAYFKAAIAILNIENNEFCDHAAAIIANANNGDFTGFAARRNALNHALKPLEKNTRNQAQMVFAICKFARDKITYENIIENRLGLRAKLALFGIALTGKI